MSDIIDIVWTPEQEPNSECRYNHVYGDCPMGQFVITWKAWKNPHEYTIDQVPWDKVGIDIGQDSLTDAKNQCQLMLDNIIKQCMIK